ncbi:MAG: 5-formyltetrahydrofolate cyclo-ligase [Candidatus Gracilibacteria bacterium]
MQKKDLRVHLREKRKAIQPALRAEKSKKIAEIFLKLKEVTDANSILFYVSKADEVETHDLIKDCIKRGVKVFVPKVNGEELLICPILNFDELSLGAYGLLEPCSIANTAHPKDIDLIVVPGIGFDKNGNRIGSGKGFYDKLLKDTRGQKIGFAFSEQIVDALPNEEHDVPLDLIVTDSLIIHS